MPLDPAAYDARRDRDGALERSTTRSSSTDAQLVVDLRNATGPRGDHEREGLEALTTRVAHAGVGGWGKNVVRVFGRARRARLDLRHRRGAPGRLRGALPAGAGDGVVRRARSPTTASTRSSIATPVPTHYELAQAGARGGQARLRREAAGDARRRDGGARRARRERDLVLMPGHLLLYHPGLRKVKELVDAGELGEVACVYGNRQNLGVIRSNENALWSLGVHDLSVILWLLGEEPTEAVAHGMDYLQHGDRGRRLLLPPLPLRQGRAHAPLLARPAQDAEDDRRRPREDGRLRRHGARAQGDRLREGALGAGGDATASGARGRGTSSAPRSRTTSRCGSSCSTSSASSRTGPATTARRYDGLAVVRTLDRLTTSLRTGAPA